MQDAPTWVMVFWLWVVAMLALGLIMGAVLVERFTHRLLSISEKLRKILAILEKK